MVPLYFLKVSRQRSGLDMWVEEETLRGIRLTLRLKGGRIGVKTFTVEVGKSPSPVSGI